MAKAKTEKKDLSTEEKILAAARKTFTKKGYAATRTRDIAEEAGINLALLNYYFRSKEKLFEIIMQEKFAKFLFGMQPVLFDAKTNLEEKIQAIVSNYIDMLSHEPDLPIFVLHEIRSNPQRFASNVPLKKTLMGSVFFKQLKEKKPDLNPLHIIVSILGMVIFPFIAQPVLIASTTATSKEFEALIQERRTLVPKWINMILNSK